MNRRLLGLIAVLVAVALTGVGNAVHVRALRAGLSEVAEEKVAEFRTESEARGESVPRIATAVVVSKANVIYGDVTGKVSLYLQAGGAEDAARISGFEFMYALEDGGWRQTESGRCSSDECTREGLKLLRQLDKY